MSTTCVVQILVQIILDFLLRKFSTKRRHIPSWSSAWERWIAAKVAISATNKIPLSICSCSPSKIKEVKKKRSSEPSILISSKRRYQDNPLKSCGHVHRREMHVCYCILLVRVFLIILKNLSFESIVFFKQRTWSWRNAQIDMAASRRWLKFFRLFNLFRASEFLSRGCPLRFYVIYHKVGKHIS